jgi:hypothetical protein
MGSDDDQQYDWMVLNNGKGWEANVAAEVSRQPTRTRDKDYRERTADRLRAGNQPSPLYVIEIWRRLSADCLEKRASRKAHLPYLMHPTRLSSMALSPAHIPTLVANLSKAATPLPTSPAPTERLMMPPMSLCPRRLACNRSRP